MSEKNMNNQKEKLPFAKNEVYRLMKDNLDNDKMIKEQVKVEMNRFLYSILKNVCQKLNEYPYTTVDYSMFNFIVQEFSGFFKPGMNCTFSGLVSIFFLCGWGDAITFQMLSDKCHIICRFIICNIERWGKTSIS